MLTVPPPRCERVRAAGARARGMRMGQDAKKAAARGAPPSKRTFRQRTGAPGPGGSSDGNLAAIEAAHTANAHTPAFERIACFQFLIQIREVILRVAASKTKRFTKEFLALLLHPPVV